MNKHLLLLSVFLLSGCVTPFSRFYYDRTGGVDITPNVVISDSEPKLFRGNNLERDNQQMFEDGYFMVGYSSFNAGNVNVNGAIIQAKQVHAAVVITYSQYTNTVSGAIPLTAPNTQTSSTSFNGSAYGAAGYQTFSGTADTTTYGTKTTYIPYNMNRFDHGATYWVKVKRPIFGVYAADLTPEDRQKIGSNKGLLIYAVIKDSPAFRADILKGDILRKIGDIEIYDLKNFQEVVNQYAGQKVHIDILREGQEIKKDIELNQKIE
jgi:S1-C subfamily serine protease